MNKELMDQYFPGVGLNEIASDGMLRNYNVSKNRTFAVVAIAIIVGAIYYKLIYEK